jgi:hypothetical protein
MVLDNLTHGLFLTRTQKSHLFTDHTLQYLHDIQHFHPIWPLHFKKDNPALLTWRIRFFAHGDECPSTLVSGLPTTVPPLAFPSHPLTPYSSSYTIYIDDINNNLSLLHPGQ